ncbi:MAG: hypothetical protein SFV55_08650 [Haliscomenobacter sp.]|uniref:hypothetical protein n=1 Tax=Haliscomenobacter sp. TaxID=2717303 RepID=UPI0029B0C3F8|nr:hypothetical protein [Haliscomenobacter sp.]MDX2068481.1 hypothetical protein [Haliscomenobacter sp.]
MKNYSSSAVLALVFLFFCKIGSAQEGYIRFVENLEIIVLQAQSYQTILEAASLVQTNLSKLSVRRTVDPTHEAIYLQKGYDLNKDGLLNQLDGFESVDDEKFSPWNYYIEIMPCGEKEPFYFEVRALGKDSIPVYLQKLIPFSDNYTSAPRCVSPFKVYLNQEQGSVKINARNLIAGKMYDGCYQNYSPIDTTISPAIQRFSLEPWYIELPGVKPDSTKKSFELSCIHRDKPILFSVFTWDEWGNYNLCLTSITVLDTTNYCIQAPVQVQLSDSLELVLYQSFSLFRPLIPANKLLKASDSLSQSKKFKVRRSIRNANLSPWIELGYDLNQDGKLSALDGFELNRKDGFVLSPWLDSLPLFCSDFQDSLLIEIAAIDSIPNILTVRWLQLKQPAFFVDYQFGIMKLLKPNENTDFHNYPELAIATLHASDFLKSPFYTCAAGVSTADFWGRKSLLTSINRIDEVPDSNQKVIKLNCRDDLSVVLAKIYVWNLSSALPLLDIVVYASVYDEKFACGIDHKWYITAVNGQIYDQKKALIPGVKVNLLSPNRPLVEQMNPFFYHANQSAPYHLITPSKTSDPLNGVSTFDLIQIQRHILNIKTFDSPYQYIAADINRSGTITTLDLIQLRKVILGIDANFANNSSWRFINVDHIFQDPTNPLKEYLPETIRIGPLYPIRNVAFIGIKIGDLNNSATLK